MSYNGGMRNIFLVILQGEVTICRTFFKLYEKKNQEERKKKTDRKNFAIRSDQLNFSHVGS